MFFNHFNKNKTQVAKAENGARNFDQKPNKRKFAKELNADKSTVTAALTNDLDDRDTKGGDEVDRPRKKDGRRKLRKKQKKSQQRTDGFFCGAPSEYWKRLQLLSQLKILFSCI